MTVRAAVLACLFAAGAVAGAAAGEAQAADYAPGELIVRFKPGVDGPERSAVRRAQGAGVKRVLPLPRTQVLDLPAGMSVERALRALERDRRVESVTPNYRVRSRGWENPDPLLHKLWAFHTAGVFHAWTARMRSRHVKVAVVDSGVDLGHEDLAPQLHLVPGADFVEGEKDTDGPDDRNGHGTRVAGTIGARGGNGKGVSGVSQDVELLPIRVLNEKNRGSLSWVLDGIDLAVAKGADIVNLSLGITLQQLNLDPDGPELTEFPEWMWEPFERHEDVLFVVAADNQGENSDEVGDWPCNYEPPAGLPDNVICVAASDRDDRPASFSNHGALHVDLAAPGVDIVSTWFKWPYYNVGEGTSFAAPHVSGAAALVLAQSRAEGAPLDGARLRERLLESVDVLTCWAGRTATGGRLNVARALRVDEKLLAALPESAACPRAAEEPPDGKQGSDTEEPSPPPSPPSVTPPPPPAPPPPPPPPPPEPEPSRSHDEARVAVDRTAPRVRITAARSRRAATLLRSGMRARIRCDEGCRLRADLIVGRNTARKLGISGRPFLGKYVLVGRSRARLDRAGTTLVTTPVARASRKDLAGVRSVRLVLRVVATDARGNARVSTRSLVVRR